MNYSIMILIVLSIFLGTGAWLIFIWAVKKGEFDDVEGAKFRMLENDPEVSDHEEEGDNDR